VSISARKCIYQTQTRKLRNTAIQFRLDEVSVKPMEQTAVSHETTILCLEDSHSHFAASQQLFGIYKIVAATSTASALAALRVLGRIDAAVLEC
jgi:hypothetical protein